MIDRAKKVVEGLRHPFYAALILVVGFFVFVTPIAFGGLSGAAQFWGAYFSSITGLAAAIGAVFLNAVIERENADRATRKAAIAFVRLSLAEFREVLQCIRYSEDHPHVPMEGNIDRDGPGVGVLMNLLDNWLQTPHTDKHIEELALLSQRLADSIIGFRSERASFQRLVGSWNKKVLELEWGLTRFILGKIRDHAAQAEVEAMDFLTKHASPD
jgi:hypothetical protein